MVLGAVLPLAAAVVLPWAGIWTRIMLVVAGLSMLATAVFRLWLL